MLDLAVQHLPVSPVRKIAEMLEKCAAKHNIISFGGGAPSLAPPREVLEHLCAEFKRDAHAASSYGSSRGMPRVREQICEMMAREEKIKIDPAKEINITAGATEALFITFRTLLNPGDHIVLCDPTYLAYYPQLNFLGEGITHHPTYVQEDFQIDINLLNEAITGKTKAMLLLSPDNPTGRILDKEILRGVVQLCEDKKIWLITDDTYKDIIYDGKFRNSRTFGGYDNTITCCSFSKSASMPGFRLGYVYGPAEFIEKVSAIKSYMTLCPSRPAQICVEKYLEKRGAVKKKYLEKTVVPTYKKRRDAMAEMMEKYLPKAEFVVPRGAFYFFPDMSRYLEKMDEEKFANKLFEKKQVVVVPGKYFGEQGKKHIRFTFVSEPEQRIKEGFIRIAHFIEENKL
jgi:aspartate aminotransferase